MGTLQILDLVDRPVLVTGAARKSSDLDMLEVAANFGVFELGHALTEETPREIHSFGRRSLQDCALRPAASGCFSAS